MTLVSVSQLDKFCQSPPHFTDTFSNDVLKHAYANLYDRSEGNSTSSSSSSGIARNEQQEVDSLITTSTTLPQATAATQINNNKKKMLRFFLAAVVYGLKLNVIPLSQDHIIQRVLGKIPMDQDVNVIPGEQYEDGFTGVSGIVGALCVITNKLGKVLATLSNLGSAYSGYLSI